MKIDVKAVSTEQLIYSLQILHATLGRINADEWSKLVDEIQQELADRLDLDKDLMNGWMIL